MHELERVQKRAMSIIFPVLNYHDVLNRMNIKKLVLRHNDICNTLFSNIQSDKDHRLHNLLLAPYETTYSLMHARPFNIPRYRTNRFKNTFIMSSSKMENM